jgi:hypothetical protein
MYRENCAPIVRLRVKFFMDSVAVYTKMWQRLSQGGHAAGSGPATLVRLREAPSNPKATQILKLSVESNTIHVLDGCAAVMD